MFPRFATFKEGTKITYGCVFLFSRLVRLRTHVRRSLLGVNQDVNQDLGSISGALSWELVFFIAKVCFFLGINIYNSGGRTLETLVKQHPEVSLFVKQVADKQHFPVFL